MTAPARLCAEPWCPNIIDGPGRYCAEHSRQMFAGIDPAPYRGAWPKIRNAHIARHPRCQQCGAPAAEVHHFDHNPRNNNPANLASLCEPCHRTITSRHGHATKKSRAKSRGGASQSRPPAAPRVASLGDLTGNSRQG